MSEISEKIKEFSNEFLLEQFNNRQHEYTDEAIALMQEEISLRNLNGNMPEENKNDVSDNEESLDTDDELVPIDNKFNRTDLVLAQSILTEEKIPFYVTSSTQSSALPLENEATNSFSIHIPKNQLEEAKECLNKHFHTTNGLYSAKYSTVKERLKSLCFYEIDLTGKELDEEVDVQFSLQESTNIRRYIEKLVNEADAIEQKSDRVLFYVDNLQDCLSHINEENRSSFPRADLLAILEVMQVYCDNEDFPQTLEKTAEVLLNFFIP